MDSQATLPQSNYFEFVCGLAERIGFANAYTKDFGNLLSSICALKTATAVVIVVHNGTPFAAWQLSDKVLKSYLLSLFSELLASMTIIAKTS